MGWPMTTDLAWCGRIGDANMDRDQFSPRDGKAFTYTGVCEGGELFKAHSYGNGHFVLGIPNDGLEVCFGLYEAHNTLDIHIYDTNLSQWLYTIPSLRNYFKSNASSRSICMDLLLPYYSEIREKFSQDRFKDLNFKALELFVLHFLRDRSIFAIFGLDYLYQEGTLTWAHFQDLDRWDCSISKNLDCLDEIVDELDKHGELDDLFLFLENIGEPDEPGEQDKQEPCHPITFIREHSRSEPQTHERDLHSLSLFALPCHVIGEPHRSKLHAFIRGGDLKAVERLLDMSQGVVDAATLYIAIRCYNSTIFLRLLDHGAEVDGSRSLFGFSNSAPLCDAVKVGNMDAVQQLLSHGANVNGGFRRPLSCAIDGGHTLIAEHLLESGAHVSTQDHMKYSGLPMSQGWHGWSDSFRRFLTDCSAATRELLFSMAGDRGIFDLADYLVSHGMDVKSDMKDSPLHRAAKNGHFGVVRFLLAHAAEIRPADVTTLLWCAAENDELDIIHLLLSRGPQLDSTLFSKLLSVANDPYVRYHVKAAGNEHEGFSICLPKDDCLSDWEYLQYDRKGFGVSHLGKQQLCKYPSYRGSISRNSSRSEKCQAIIRKLAAKIDMAREEVRADYGCSPFRSFKSFVQRWLKGEATEEEKCPAVAAIQAQERRNVLRRLFTKLGSSLKKLLHAGASQCASTGLVNFAHNAGTETSRATWRRGTRAIRNIGEGRLPSSLSEIFSVLQVANAMRAAVPPSDLVCSRKEFVNDIPKWAALLNQEDQRLFLEVAEHLWGLPPHVEIDPTPDTFSILEDLKRLVNSLMTASGLFDDDSECSSSCYRLQSLRQRHLSGMSPSHTYEGNPLLTEWSPPPAPDLQENPHTNKPKPPDPEGGPPNILRDITYLVTGAIFGVILLFLCLTRYGYSTACLPILPSYDRQDLDMAQIMKRNHVILAVYTGATFPDDLGTWKRTDHLPLPTSLSPEKPHSVAQGGAKEHLEAFESRCEGAYTTINPPYILDTTTEDASPSLPKLQPQAPKSSSASSVSPSTTTTTTATPPGLTGAAVSEDGFMYCAVASCTSKFQPGKNQRSNYNKHQREQHIKKVMHECKWEGCGRKRSSKWNLELHEGTCKKKSNGIRANLRKSGRR